MKRSSVRWLYRLPLYCFCLWAVGFTYFIFKIPSIDQSQLPPKSEAIVVLTGDSNRLSLGVRLLKEGYGKRLLLSGVHSSVKAEELAALVREDISLFSCCIDLGFDAENTVGNVWETQKWRQKNNFKGLLLVTSDYHMPRALLLFNRLDKDGVYYAAASPSEAPLRFYIREYHKYLVTLIRHGQVEE